MAVWVNPSPSLTRRTRGPAKIFRSTIALSLQNPTRRRFDYFDIFTEAFVKDKTS